MNRAHLLAPTTDSPLLSIVYTLSSLCVVVACATLAFAQTPEESPTVVTTTKAVERAQDAVEKVKAKSIIRGRIVFDDTERPVRRAQVTLLSFKGGGPPQGARTDGRGEFEIKNVRAGTYFVTVDAVGVMAPISLVNVQEIDRDKFNADEIRKYFTEVIVDGENSASINFYDRGRILAFDNRGMGSRTLDWRSTR